MTKLIAILTLVLGGIHAQAATNSINLTVAPVGVAIDSTQVGAEFAVARNMSLALRYAHVDTNLKDLEANGESFGLAAKFYLTNDALNGGLYAAPAIDIPNYDLTATIDGDTGSANLTDPIYSALVGYQWMWDHFNINLAAGVSHLSGLESVAVARAGGGTDQVEVPDLLPNGELTLGWAF